MKLTRSPLPIVILVYVVFYGALIYLGSGLPYVMDNNETFSSLWHAHSLSEFGWSQTKGLADEVFSPHPEASPFVHSHQGNLPRIFAWLIYELGARTAEAQIIITTFTIGLGTITLIYLFFEQISNSTIGLVAALVFLTDYLLFAQWQIVTYRVWYGFLLFAMLFTIEKVRSHQSYKWCGLLFIFSACLLYFELIFAAFVGVWCVLWALYRVRKNWRLLTVVILTMGAGAAVGLSIFLAQAIAYLGWSDFITDIYQTFGARNNVDSHGSRIYEIYKFYESKQVIFWFNFQDKSAFYNFRAFFRSIVVNDVNAHAPIFVALIYSLLACWIINHIVAKVKTAKVSGIANFKLFNLNEGFAYLTYSAITFAAGLGLNLIYRQYWGGGPSIDELLSILLITTPIALCLISITSNNTDTKFWSIFLYVLVSLAVFNWIWQAFDNQHIPVLKYLEGGADFGLIWVAFVSIIFVSKIGQTLSINDEWFQERSAKLVPVLICMIVGFISYSFIYSLSPGYIYTGYVVRLAPFTVFITDLVYVIVFSFISLTVISASIKRNKKLEDVCAGIRLITLLAITSAIFFFWCAVQVRAIRLFPINHFDFTKKLGAPPYYGASFVTNNYAAPIAAYTHQWAYMDPEIANAKSFADTRGNLNLIGDSRYLWFADKKSNEDYRRPDYFICVFNQTLGSAVPISLKVEGLPVHNPNGCNNVPLVRLAVQPANPFGLRLVEMDSDGPSTVGFVRWAIVKFDWVGKHSHGLYWEGDANVSLPKVRKFHQ